MCKYCDYYVKDDDNDLVEFNNIIVNIANGTIKLDFACYISGDGKEANLVTSYLIDTDVAFLDGESKKIPIKYCPFCGKELVKDRKEVEENGK